jgi:hypothetical protein
MLASKYFPNHVDISTVLQLILLIKWSVKPVVKGGINTEKEVNSRAVNLDLLLRLLKGTRNNFKGSASWGYLLRRFVVPCLLNCYCTHSITIATTIIELISLLIVDFWVCYLCLYLFRVICILWFMFSFSFKGTLGIRSSHSHRTHICESFGKQKFFQCPQVPYLRKAV